MRKTLVVGGAISLAALSGWAAQAAVPVAEAGPASRTVLLLVQLGLILVATKLGSMVSEAVRLPGVLGELAAGMLIGPFVLGGLALPGFPAGLFPLHEGIPVSMELYGFCSVAAVLLLFVTGLETDVHMLLRHSGAGLAVGLVGALLAFVAGDVVAAVLWPRLFGESRGFLHPSCLFLGAVATVTSVGISARVLAARRRLDSPEGMTILSGATVDDVLGIFLVAVVIGLCGAVVAGAEAAGARVGMVAAKTFGIWLVAVGLGLFGARYAGRLLKRFPDHASIAVVALGLALILAGLLERAGLAVMIGAYVTGLALSHSDLAYVVRERLSPVYLFLVPVFFGVMGMMVDWRAAAARPMVVLALAYTAAALLAKLVGAAVPAWLFGFSLRGAWRVGAGMMPRGEMALVMAGIGVAAGGLGGDTPVLFAVAVVMVFLSVLVGAPAMHLAFRGGVGGLRRAAGGGPEARCEFPFPTPAMAHWAVGKLIAVFDDEGFYVQQLHRRQDLFHLRKGRVAITLARDGGRLLFTSDANVATFVRTAVYDVLGELQGTIRGLQEPVDAMSVVGQIVPDRQAGPGPHLRLQDFVRPELLKPRLEATNKTDVIRELLGLLEEQDLVRDPAAALEALLAREASMSTGLQHGIAIPHARTNAVDKLVCAIGLKPAGLNFEALDGQPSRIFILTLSPQDAPVPHVQFISGISQALTEERRRRLLACRSADQMYI